MDAISNVDRLVLVLRQRLQERARRAAANSSDRSASADTNRLEKLHALAAVEGVDDRQLGRALIQNILADQFGAGLINDAKFQQLVDRVTETLREDEAGDALLGRMVTELRDAAR